jgi:hypothetical protein
MIRKQNKYIFNKPCHCYLSSQMSICCRCVDCRVENSRGNNLNYEPNANITNIKNVNTTAIWTTLVQCWLTPLSVLLE